MKPNQIWIQDHNQPFLLPPLDLGPKWKGFETDSDPSLEVRDKKATKFNLLFDKFVDSKGFQVFGSTWLRKVSKQIPYQKILSHFFIVQLITWKTTKVEQWLNFNVFGGTMPNRLTFHVTIHKKFTLIVLQKKLFW